MSLLGRAKRSRRFTLLLVATPVAGILAVLGLLLFGAFQGTPGPVQAKEPLRVQGQLSTMEKRLDQVIQILQEGNDDAVMGALDASMDVLWGGIRPLVSKDLIEETDAAHIAVSARELQLAGVLEALAGQTRPSNPDIPRRALDLKLFIEQMNEVAHAVGGITSQCGEGDMIGDLDPANPCNDLLPLLHEDEDFILPGQPTIPIPIFPSYSVKLRSPVVPQPWSLSWEEDVRVTEPLADGECAVVFKETKGLMLRLHFERITIVSDPWVSVFGLPRGTPVPIWRLEWVPSEYVKTWNICNQAGVTSVYHLQSVKQDHPLNFFWRYYRSDRVVQLR